MEEKTYQQIIDLWNQTSSVRETAHACRVSEVKARRVLITEGLWSSHSSREIGELYRKGKSVKKIADELHMSEKNVQAYVPYSRGLYGKEPSTVSAFHSKSYRSRNQFVKERIVKRGKKVMPREKGIVMKGKMPLRLHLELLNGYNDQDKKVIDTLHRYGNVKYGDHITRDILVPGDICLYNLHYCIQRCFGWQNSHLHSFHLTDQKFHDLLKDQTGRWMNLCGILFRSPDMEEDYRFLLDDYEDGSFRTWIRRKYTGPYQLKNKGESFAYCQKQMEQLYDEGPYRVYEGFTDSDGWYCEPEAESASRKAAEDEKFTIVPLREVPLTALKYYFKGDMSELLERLTVEDLLSTDPDESEDFYEKTCLDHTYMEPITDTLIYTYDFGDDWKVRITIMKDCSDLLSSYRLSQTKLDHAIARCIADYRPVCIAMDGLNVMDDAGNVSGYAVFLRSIHDDTEHGDNGPYEDRESSLDWASMFDWKPAMPKAETLL